MSICYMGQSKFAHFQQNLFGCRSSSEMIGRLFVAYDFECSMLQMNNLIKNIIIFSDI